MCFALIRYFLDKLRGDLLETYSGLYPTQIIAVFIFALGALWFISSTKLYQEFEGQEKTSSSDNLLPDEKEDENEDSHIEDPLSQ